MIVSSHIFLTFCSFSCYDTHSVILKEKTLKHDLMFKVYSHIYVLNWDIFSESYLVLVYWTINIQHFTF